MKFEQLEHFLEIYKKKNISKAADVFYASHQHISYSLNSLEEELGAQLFTRSKKGVTATHAGELFYVFAKETIDKYNDFKIALIDSASTDTLPDSITIILPTSIFRHYSNELFNLLSNLHSYKDIKFQLFSLNTFNDELYPEECFPDIIIYDKTQTQDVPPFYESIIPEYYIREPICEVFYYLWVSQNAPLGSYDVITPEILDKHNMNFIYFKHYLAYKKLLFNLNRNPWFKNRTSFETYDAFIHALKDSNNFTIDLAINGKPFLYKELKNLKMRYRPFPIIKSSIIIAYKKETPKDLISFLIKEIESL